LIGSALHRHALLAALGTNGRAEETETTSMTATRLA
jgi:hypothetical protein